MTWLKALTLSCLAILAPLRAVMIVVGLLILADTLTGILAARKRGEQIKSSAMRRTISKAIVYQVAILSGFLCEKFLIGDFVAISKLIAGAIGVVELKSILENGNAIVGGNLFSAIVGKLGSPNDADKPKGNNP